MKKVLLTFVILAFLSSCDQKKATKKQEAPKPETKTETIKEVFVIILTKPVNLGRFCYFC